MCDEEGAPRVQTEQPIPLREAAARVGQTPRRLRGWIKLGVLPAAKPGRDYLVRAADVEALLVPTKLEARAR